MDTIYGKQVYLDRHCLLFVNAERAEITFSRVHGTYLKHEIRKPYNIRWVGGKTLKSLVLGHDEPHADPEAHSEDYLHPQNGGGPPHSPRISFRKGYCNAQMHLFMYQRGFERGGALPSAKRRAFCTQHGFVAFIDTWRRPGAGPGHSYVYIVYRRIVSIELAPAGHSLHVHA